MMIFSKTITSIVVVLFAFSAFALDLDAARDKGIVKELPTGFIEASAEKPKKEVVELVVEVNKKRAEYYKEVAKKNKTSVDVVAKQAAEKIKEKLAKK